MSSRVKEMVSVFETLNSAPSSSTAPCDGEHVMLRGNRIRRKIPRVRLCDSWPIGKIEWNTLQTTEPISSLIFSSEISSRSSTTISTTSLITGPTTTSISSSTIGHTTSLTTGHTTTSISSSTTGPITTSFTSCTKGPTFSVSGPISTDFSLRPCKGSVVDDSLVCGADPVVGNFLVDGNEVVDGCGSGLKGMVLDRGSGSAGAAQSILGCMVVPLCEEQPVFGSTSSALTCRRTSGEGLTFRPELQLQTSGFSLFSLLQFLHSGSSNSMVAIDNKIEQAMDLVKTHLMLAVREEVEILKEQIKDLSERNAQLERENYILRALREPH